MKLWKFMIIMNKQHMIGVCLLSLLLLSSTCFSFTMFGGKTKQTCSAGGICEQGKCILDEASEELNKAIAILQVK